MQHKDFRGFFVVRHNFSKNSVVSWIDVNNISYFTNDFKATFLNMIPIILPTPTSILPPGHINQ